MSEYIIAGKNIHGYSDMRVKYDACTGAIICGSGEVRSPFGPRNIFSGFHWGIDLSTSGGELPVRAPEGGNVTTSHADGGGSGGRTVTLIGDSGAKYVFMHLSSFASDKGSWRAEKGDVVGITGNSGLHTTGPHLHFAYAPIGGSKYKLGYADPYGHIFYELNSDTPPSPPAEFKEYSGPETVSTKDQGTYKPTGYSAVGNEEEYYYPSGTGKADSDKGNLVLNSTSVNLTSDFINEKNAASYQNVMRIYVDPSIKSTITVDGINLKDYSSHGEESSQYSMDVNDMKNATGISYPLIKMKRHIFNHREIIKFEVDYSDFTPKVRGIFMILKDSNLTANMPLEGDLLNVEIRSRNPILKSIRQDFVITSVIVMGNGAGMYGKMMMIRGKLQVEGLTSYSVEIPGFNGTSKDVLMNSAVNLGLGFAFNDFDNTSDVQTWSSGEKTMEEFIIDTTNRAWKNPESFFKSWIDPYYNLTFINVNYTLNSPDSEKCTDITAFTNNVPTRADYNEEDYVKDIPLYKMFTNLEQFKGTPFYIIKWNPVNNVNTVRESIGNDRTASIYLHNQNLVNQEVESYEDVMIGTANNPAKLETTVHLQNNRQTDTDANPDVAKQNPKSVTLKSAPQVQQTASDDDAKTAESNRSDISKRYTLDSMKTSTSSFNSVTGETTTETKTYTAAETMTTTSTTNAAGKSTVDNTTYSGNTNQNYLTSNEQNYINNMELEKLYIVITVSGACMQVLRGDRVPVYLTRKWKDATQVPDDEYVKNPAAYKFYCGNYIVDGIKYIYDPNMVRDKEATDIPEYNMYTELTLKRREWPYPEDVKKS